MTMYTVINHKNINLMKTKQQWHDMQVLAEELDLKLCYPENFLILKMIVDMSQKTKSPTMIERAFEWYNSLSDWKKTAVATAIGLIAIGALVAGKQNNLF
jgi:hypothetical protein